MADHTLAAVMHRLERLERDNYRWKILGCTTVTVLALVILLGAIGGKDPNVAEEIRVRRLTVVDEDGNPRIVLGKIGLCAWRKEKDEGLGLALFDADKKLRVAIGVPSITGASGLYLCGEDEMPRASLNVGNKTPALYLAGDDSRDRVWLEVAGNRPRLVFRDEQLERRVVLGAFSLELNSGVTELRPTSSLVLIQENGRVWKAP